MHVLYIKFFIQSAAAASPLGANYSKFQDAHYGRRGRVVKSWQEHLEDKRADDERDKLEEQLRDISNVTTKCREFPVCTRRSVRLFLLLSFGEIDFY